VIFLGGEGATFVEIFCFSYISGMIRKMNELERIYYNWNRSRKNYCDRN